MTPHDLVRAKYQFPFESKPFQIEVINDLAGLDGAGYWLDMGCVDSETEYLSPAGWKKISEYDGGQVLQYTPDLSQPYGVGSGEFVAPVLYHKLPCDQMIKIKTGYGVDQMLSPEHRVAYYDYRGYFKETTAEEVHLKAITKTHGWVGGIPTVFNLKSTSSLSFTEAELRLMVAVIADGHYQTKGSTRCIVRVKKERKIERLRQLLRDWGGDFREEEETWVGCEGFHRFTFCTPVQLKVFDSRFWGASYDQLKIIVDEVKHWDSAIDPRGTGSVRFFTSVKDSADFIQYAYTATGTRAAMAYVFRQREDRKDSHEYSVHTYKGRTVARVTGPSQGYQAVTVEPSTDGFKYCFTVPSGFLVLRRGGYVFVTGNCGKTYCATSSALYFLASHRLPTVIVVPPILIRQWANWLRSIKPALSVTEYRGTPAERSKLSLKADFVVVGMQIFKRDYQRFIDEYGFTTRTLIIDEATMICNVGSDNHKKVWDFRCGPTMLLTGTPANKPTDAYGLLKFTAPGEYKSERQFLNTYVKSFDFFGNPEEFHNLDLLAEKLRINSKRILLEDIYDQMPPVSYIPLDYDLEPKHYKLYKKLSEEQLLMLENGDKIDATQGNNLIHKLGQIICNYSHFSGNPEDVSNGFDLIEEKLSELGNGKLVVFANYRLTIANICQHFAKYNPVAANSEVTAKQKDKNVERFIHDPDCRMFVAQPVSAGYGIDGLQKVCNHMIFIEPCSQPRDFHQAVARLARQGQVKPVQVYMAVAGKTLQGKRFSMLLHNDAVSNQIIRSAVELRKVIYGG